MVPEPDASGEQAGELDRAANRAATLSILMPTGWLTSACRVA